MNDFLPLSQSVVAFSATYLMHSTALLGGCWIAVRLSRISSHSLVERLWKLAAVLGVLTAAIQCGAGADPVLDAVLPKPMDLKSGGVLIESAISLPEQETRDTSASTARPLQPTAAFPIEMDLVEPTSHQEPMLELGGTPHWHPAPSELTTALAERFELAAPTHVDNQLPIASPALSTQRSTAAKSHGLRALPTAIFKTISFTLATSMFGAMLLLAFQSLRHRARFSDARVLRNGAARQVLDRFLEHNRIRRRVRLLSSNCCAEPITYGLVHWTIVLPPGTDRRLGRDELRALLAHEVAHLVRGDVRWLWMGRVLCVCFSFQPLNFIARRRWQMAAEYLCDDWAVASGIRSLSLARCLTQIAGWRFGRPCEVGLAAGGSTTTLVQRVERLVEGSQAVDAWSKPLRRRVVNLAAIMSIPLLVGFAPRVRVPLPAEPQAHAQRDVQHGDEAAPVAHQDLKTEWGQLEEELLQLEAALDRANDLMKDVPHQSSAARYRNEIHRRAALLRARCEQITLPFGKES